MDRLYRYFLYLIKQGFDLLGAVAKAAIKFGDVPAKQVYNVAVSAFASRAAGQWMGENPDSPLSRILNQSSSVDLAFNRIYSPAELLNLFPRLVGPPYQIIGASYIESPSVSGYRTYTAYISDDSTYTSIVNIAGVLWEYKYLISNGEITLISKAIVGRPILVDY